MDKTDKLTRRLFLRQLGMASMIPLLARGASADTTDTATAPTPSEAASGSRHRFVTANILATLSEHDGTPVDWETRRRDVCFKVLKDQEADIICLQEVLRSQLADFKKGFPEFELFGYEGPYMDTNPERFQGIKNVIMYKRDRYEQSAAGSYTLSETPLIEGSTSWGDTLGRHVNWVRLREKSTGKEFRVLNTHLSVRNPQARQESAKIINTESGQYQEDFPQLLLGDMNDTVVSETIKMLKAGGWKDTFEAVHGDKDPGRTGHGFKQEKIASPDTPDTQIDWIFFRGEVRPVAAKVIWDNVNGEYPSDHLFVSADVLL